MDGWMDGGNQLTTTVRRRDFGHLAGLSFLDPGRIRGRRPEATEERSLFPVCRGFCMEQWWKDERAVS